MILFVQRSAGTLVVCCCWFFSLNFIYTSRRRIDLSIHLLLINNYYLNVFYTLGLKRKAPISFIGELLPINVVF